MTYKVGWVCIQNDYRDILEEHQAKFADFGISSVIRTVNGELGLYIEYDTVEGEQDIYGIMVESFEYYSPNEAKLTYKDLRKRDKVRELGVLKHEIGTPEGDTHNE